MIDPLLALRVAACVIAFGACGRSETADAPRPPPEAPRAAAIIPDDARELVTAIVDDWSTTKATLRRYRREGTTWKPVGEPWPGVVGKSGAAWGAGLHGTGAPAGREGPVKREGDGKSPAGAFALTASYGYANAAPAGTRIKYTPLDTAWKCVDDPASRSYNRVLDQRTTEIDWKSAEEMKRTDALYTWVVDVAHNASRTPSGGSCIFLHVWSGPDGSTLGCTAMAEPVLAELIATLDPSAVFVLLPKAEYAALAPGWGLPR